VGSWEYDPPSGIFWGSDEAFRLFGLPCGDGEVARETIEACIVDRERVSRAFDFLIDGAEEYDLEYEVRPADGSAPRILKSVREILRDEHGNPVKVIGVVQDITGRKRAEEALRTSEREQREIARQLEIERARLLQAQDVANVGSWECELADMKLIWSAQTYRIFEAAPAAFPATYGAFLELVHPGDRKKFEAALQASLEKDAPCAVEHRAVLGDGRVKTVEERWQVFRDEGGKPLRVVGTCLDVTTRVHAEEQIRAAHQRLTYHVENSPLAVVEWDRNFRVKRWPRRAEEMFGWREEEVMGLCPTDWKFIYPEDLPAAGRMIEGLFHGRGQRSFHLNRNYTRDGRVLHCEWYNSVMLGTDGRPDSILSLAQDVTERTQAEDAVLRSRQQLRALSARLETLREEERTRIAREIHDELGQMLTGIKMDLRWAERRLDEMGDDGRLNPILDKLVDAGELTDATVRTVQRIAAELRPGILDKLGLPMALEYEAEQFRRRTRIPCRLDLPGDVPRLRPETATAFFRIFQEALTNVSRHSQATAVEAAFRLEGGEWRLEIRDNGKGITASDLARPASLGLLGMQERARLLGGDVRFSPGERGGTVVTVLIPVEGGAQEAV
jgi:PAS domain S-box-containing protein